ncbi:MAG: hypothetical protein C4289_01175 [Chloroflexota bacterium]
MLEQPPGEHSQRAARAAPGTNSLQTLVPVETMQPVNDRAAEVKQVNTNNEDVRPQVAFYWQRTQEA